MTSLPQIKLNRMPPNCPDVENPEHRFGIWRSDYTPKPAATMIIEWFGS